MSDLLEQQDSQSMSTTEVSPNVGDASSGSNTDSVTTGTWLDTLPEAFRQEGSIKRHDSMEALLKSYTHGQSLIGNKNYVPDFENDSPEVIGAFREKLGVPKTADEYNFELPENFTPDEGFNAFKELALKGNVPNDVANQFFGMHQEALQGVANQIQTQQNAEIDAAFEEFAKDPNFSDISNNARNILNQIDPAGEFLTEQSLAELGVLAPNVARFLNKAATMIADDSVPMGKNNQSFGSYEEMHSEIMTDYNAGRISQETANQRINDLTARMFPNR